MEQLQELLCIYFGIEILLSIYTLFKYNKLQKLCKKSQDFSPLKGLFFRFLTIFFIILAVFIIHLGYLTGSVSLVWPPLVAIGIILITTICAALPNKHPSK